MGDARRDVDVGGDHRELAWTAASRRPAAPTAAHATAALRRGVDRVGDIAPPEALEREVVVDGAGRHGSERGSGWRLI